MTQQIDPCATMRNNLIAAALGLQRCTKIAANIVPLPGTDRFIAIGTPAEVARLLEIAPAQPVAASAGIEGLDYWTGHEIMSDPSMDCIKFIPAVQVEHLLATQSAQGAQPEPSKPTDVSTKLRDAVESGLVGVMADKRMLLAAAEEIERYYGGMLAWKQTAEKKDRDWNTERMARVNERCAERAASAAGAGSEQARGCGGTGKLEGSDMPCLGCDACPAFAPSVPVQDERADFEREMKLDRFQRERHPVLQDDYKQPDVQCAWVGWQARSALAQQGHAAGDAQPVQDGEKDDFARGYFCATAVMLREWGNANADVRSLFGQGGDPTKADESDQELFREHGLMAAAQQDAQGEQP